MEARDELSLVAGTARDPLRSSPTVDPVPADEWRLAALREREDPERLHPSIRMSAESHGCGCQMIVHYHAPRSPDPNDPYLPLRDLEKIYGVPPSRFRKLHEQGRLELRLGRLGRFDAYFARPSQLLDVPFFRAGEVARFCRVVVETVHRARRSGKLPMVKPRGCNQYRAAPRDVIAYKRHLDLRRGKAKLCLTSITFVHRRQLPLCT